MPQKVNTDCTREVLRAVGTDEKEQMVRTMHELKVVVHEVVSPVGLLEAKNAPMDRKKVKRADKGAIASNKRRIMAPFPYVKGSKR